MRFDNSQPVWHFKIHSPAFIRFTKTVSPHISLTLYFYIRSSFSLHSKSGKYKWDSWVLSKQTFRNNNKKKTTATDSPRASYEMGRNPSLKAFISHAFRESVYICGSVLIWSCTFTNCNEFHPVFVPRFAIQLSYRVRMLIRACTIFSSSDPFFYF